MMIGLKSTHGMWRRVRALAVPKAVVLAQVDTARGWRWHLRQWWLRVRTWLVTICDRLHIWRSPRPLDISPDPEAELGLSTLKLLARLRRIWADALHLNPIQLYRILRTPMGEALISQLRLAPESDIPADKLALRHALDRVAEEVNKEDSTFGVGHHVWIRLRLDRDRLLAATRQFEQLATDTDTIVRAIAALSNDEAAYDPIVNYAKLPDLREPGQFQPESFEFQIEDACRDERQFQVVAYRPSPWRSPRTPVVVISHGLGAAPHDFHEYASYLASRGFFVALPQHLGSDAAHVGDLLSGKADDIFDLHEFVERPWDVSCLLDHLERRNADSYNGQLDLSRVGAIGHSFGGYTVLALAGADIDFNKLERACEPVLNAPNPSLLLQCRALALPRQVYDLRDRRIQAIIPIDPVGSEVFGPLGTRHVRIPTLAIAGSEDRAAPAIWEPIRMFPWLSTRDRYLALMRGKAHAGTFSAPRSTFKQSLSQALRSATTADPQQFHDYAYALSLAFLEVHIAGNASYRAFLQSAYARYLSHAPDTLDLLTFASADALERELHDLRYLSEWVW